MNNIRNIIHLIKFLIYGSFVYFLLNFVPERKISNHDLVMIIMITMTLYTLLEFIAPNRMARRYINKKNKETFSDESVPPTEIKDPLVPVTEPVQKIEPEVKKPVEEVNEMKYTEFDQQMHKPLGEYDNTVTNKFEYGYAYLNTDKWTVPMKRPPVCIPPENPCPICPVMTSGYPINLKEFNSALRITPVDNINIKYIKEVLNKEK
jgi:hypothetical protein